MTKNVPLTSFSSLGYGSKSGRHVVVVVAVAVVVVVVESKRRKLK